MQRNEGNSEQRHFVDGEFNNEWQVNVVGSNKDTDQWELVQSADSASQPSPKALEKSVSTPSIPST